jgi:hypothetical protein|tara:strand:- start:648 stop:1148 length:501 start_codon:yes stop_codon:yes gene_type:complete
MSNKLNGKAKAKARAKAFKAKQAPKATKLHAKINATNLLRVIEETAKILIKDNPEQNYRDIDGYMMTACETLLNMKPELHKHGEQIKDISLNYVEHINHKHGVCISSGAPAWNEEPEDLLKAGNVPQLQSVMMGVLDALGGMIMMRTGGAGTNFRIINMNTFMETA